MLIRWLGCALLVLHRYLSFLPDYDTFAEWGSDQLVSGTATCIFQPEIPQVWIWGLQQDILGTGEPGAASSPKTWSHTHPQEMTFVMVRPCDLVTLGGQSCVIRTESSDSLHRCALQVDVHGHTRCHRSVLGLGKEIFQGELSDPGEVIHALLSSRNRGGERNEAGDFPLETQSHQWQDHYPAPIPCTPKKIHPVKRCRVCYAYGKRKETRYHCPCCPTNPGLHVKECFRIYHQNKLLETIEVQRMLDGLQKWSEENWLSRRYLDGLVANGRSIYSSGSSLCAWTILLL